MRLIDTHAPRRSLVKKLEEKNDWRRLSAADEEWHSCQGWVTVRVRITLCGPDFLQKSTHFHETWIFIKYSCMNFLTKSWSDSPFVADFLHTFTKFHKVLLHEHSEEIRIDSFDPDFCGLPIFFLFWFNLLFCVTWCLGKYQSPVCPQCTRHFQN